MNIYFNNQKYKLILNNQIWNINPIHKIEIPENVLFSSDNKILMDISNNYLIQKED